MSKKLVALFLMVCVIFSLEGCGKSTGSVNKSTTSDADSKGTSNVGAEQVDSSTKVLDTKNFDKVTYTIDGTKFKVGDPVSKIKSLGYSYYMSTNDDAVCMLKTQTSNIFEVVFMKKDMSTVSLYVKADKNKKDEILAGIIVGAGIDRSVNSSAVNVKFSNGINIGLSLDDYKKTYPLPTEARCIYQEKDSLFYTYDGDNNSLLTVEFTGNELKRIALIGKGV